METEMAAPCLTEEITELERIFGPDFWLEVLDDKPDQTPWKGPGRRTNASLFVRDVNDVQIAGPVRCNSADAHHLAGLVSPAKCRSIDVEYIQMAPIDGAKAIAQALIANMLVAKRTGREE